MPKLSDREWDDIIHHMIVENEGGFVDHPADKGGPTNYGVTIPTLSEWMGRTADKNDIKNLTLDEAVDLYYDLFVDETNLKEINTSDFVEGTTKQLATLLLDTVVNHGRNRGAKMIQRALGVVEDGIIGPKTLAAVGKFPNTAFYNLIAVRMKAYAGIVSSNASQVVFLAGWLNRLSKFLPMK